METISAAPRILRRPELEKVIGLSRTAIYNRIDPKHPSYDPDFPKPIELGDGKNPPVGWIEAEVFGWLNNRIAMSRKAA